MIGTTPLPPTAVDVYYTRRHGDVIAVVTLPVLPPRWAQLAPPGM